jgi:hypothetical protein
MAAPVTPWPARPCEPPTNGRAYFAGTTIGRAAAPLG